MEQGPILYRVTKEFRAEELNEYGVQLLAARNVEAWNRLRDDSPEWIPDIPDLSLPGATLPGINMKGAHLPNFYAPGANFEGGFFTEAQMPNAYMPAANFSKCTLIKVNMSQKSNVSGANFMDAKIMDGNWESIIAGACHLERANGSGLNLAWSNISGSFCDGIIMDEHTNVIGLECSGVQDFDLRVFLQHKRWPPPEETWKKTGHTVPTPAEALHASQSNPGRVRQFVAAGLRRIGVQ